MLCLAAIATHRWASIVFLGYSPAMIDDSLLPFSLPSVGRKKITAAFDGGRISSDGGVMLLSLAERRMGIADRLAAKITDRRPTRHGLCMRFPTSSALASWPLPAATPVRSTSYRFHVA
jgi:Transposase DDE domain group 1